MTYVTCYTASGRTVDVPLRGVFMNDQHASREAVRAMERSEPGQGWRAGAVHEQDPIIRRS